MKTDHNIEALESKLQAAEAAVQDLFKMGKVPTPADYAEVDRIKSELKVARRVRAMNEKRVDPKLTRKVTILLPDDEYRALTEKATDAGVDLSKYIRTLLRNKS